MYRATCSKLCKLVGIIAWIINMYPYLYHFHSEWIFSSFKQSFRRTFHGRIPQNSMGKKRCDPIYYEEVPSSCCWILVSSFLNKFRDSSSVSVGCTYILANLSCERMVCWILKEKVRFTLSNYHKSPIFNLNYETG